jgi:hypothetical protein
MKWYSAAEIRKTLSLLAGIALVAVCFLNLWQGNRNLSYLKLRADDDVVVWEDRLRFVRNELMKADYRIGDVGYMPIGVFLGNTPTSSEEAHWVQARYVMIPWNLVPDTLDSPYVLFDLTGTSRALPVVDGFHPLYNSGDGLLLLQRDSPK